MQHLVETNILEDAEVAEVKAPPAPRERTREILVKAMRAEVERISTLGVCFAIIMVGRWSLEMAKQHLISATRGLLHTLMTAGYRARPRIPQSAAN